MLISITWEGSGLFSSVIIIFLLAKLFWNRFNVQHLYLYLTWITPVFIGIFLLTKAYLTLAPFALLAWGVPLYFFIISGAFFFLNYLTKLKTRTNFDTFLSSGLCSILVGSCIVGFFIAISWVVSPTFTLQKIFAFVDNFLSPLGGSRLMRTVSELHHPSAIEWTRWYGISFLLFSAGTILSIRKISQSLGFHPWWNLSIWEIFLAGVILNRFYSTSFSVSGRSSQIIYALSLVLFSLTLVINELRLKKRSETLPDRKFDKTLFALCYFLIMLLVARGAQRYHFFFAPIALMFGGFAFSEAFKVVRNHVSSFRLQVIAFVGILSLVGLVFFTSVRTSLVIARSSQPLITPEWKKAMEWMREKLPQSSVIAAWWDYGSWINTLALKATIVDEDHFIPHWIHLIARHVFCGEENEALGFLKAHQATHITFSLNDLMHLPEISWIGSDPKNDRLVAVGRFFSSEGLVPLERNKWLLPLKPLNTLIGDTDIVLKNGTIPKNEWTIMNIHVLFEGEKREDIKLVQTNMVIGTQSGQSIKLPVQNTYFLSQELQVVNESIPGSVIILPMCAIYLSGKAEKYLIVKLLLNQKQSMFFHRIYPVETNESHLPEVQIWSIFFPEHISFPKGFYSNSRKEITLCLLTKRPFQDVPVNNDNCFEQPLFPQIL